MIDSRSLRIFRYRIDFDNSLTNRPDEQFVYATKRTMTRQKRLMMLSEVYEMLRGQFRGQGCNPGLVTCRNERRNYRRKILFSIKTMTTTNEQP